MTRRSSTPSELPCEVAPRVGDRDDLHSRFAKTVGNRYPPLHSDCTQPRQNVVAAPSSLWKFGESHAGRVDAVEVIVRNRKTRFTGDIKAEFG